MAEPEQAKPRSRLARVGTALAVALTGAGTALAGLSSGQMDLAQYWRSLAAQDQSRAASQWALAGFKRTRAVAVGASARTARAAGAEGPLKSAEAFRAAAEPVLAGFPAGEARPDLNALLADPAARALFGRPVAPHAEPPAIADAQLNELLQALKAKKPASEVRALAARVDRDTADAAIRDIELYAAKYDADLKSLVGAQHKLDDFVAALDAGADDAINPQGARTAARLLARTRAALDALDERIYDQETQISQATGDRYEARVFVSDVRADVHRVKSMYFFYAMILVQAGAGIAALAGDRGAALVALALAVGLAGVAVGVYTYASANPALPGL